MFPFVFLLHNDINIKNIIQMKKLFTYLLLLLASSLLGCTQPYDDTEVRQDIENLKDRVTALEKLCKEMNANIDAMAAILEALETHDYITGVTPITKDGETVGYTITFAKGEPITIYHGEDGKDGVDGANGADGKDGYTPVIGVAQDSDGIYYWTLDGEWLLDDAGNKIKAVGVDGKDGADGKDGQDGENGANGSDGEDGENGADGKDGVDGENGVDGKDGVDGITPQLKIENDYWYISYDNGSTWSQLGKATGEDGKDGANGSDGADGADGKDGDSFFEGVDTSNDDYVVFTLADGTTIKIPTWYAFEQLKKQCEEMNQNISAMQQILEALQNNDYVTSVQHIIKDGKTIGYTIYFSKSGAVTIYHGKDGKDGADGTDGVNGADGKDGHSPIVGVRQDGDGIYYWTLDGEWLLDDAGNKIKAVGVDGKDGQDGADGEDGKDGQNGADGADGVDGENGADGITPKLKIENEYWYISYDNGTTWSQLGKATGEDGKDGANGSDGADGADGDAFFESVDTSDKNYVILTLIDGTTIQIPTWYAFEQLQALCNQMNSNIEALQTIVEALQNNDYVTSVTPVVDGGKTIGYTIYFSKSGAVTIYHGENGENGKDGASGLDGHSPQIGVKQHTDGIYYWTLDGEWLTDANGNKIKAVGIDGKDGQDGADGTDGVDGENGADGKDGVDGITPQLKIENAYWYISYDNGATWSQLGKATGEDGKDGANGSDGADGKDGDSFFQSVDSSNSEYVVITLADATVIKLPTWSAFEALRTLCNQMNSNIEALQTIVAALQNNDYVTSVTPVLENGKTVGYTINFSRSGAVTIYHGENGENGKDGANGLDGHSPQIGVKQHTDGIYYWTLDGAWLKDANGNKIKAVGIDGANGSNGTNGVDGITPQLKIENEYWYISYDNGTTWSQLGKATGEDGKDGANGSDGADGKDGDSFFQSVTQDEQYVYFTLADGTQITLPKGALLSISLDASDLVVMAPNSTREIGYTVQSVTESVTLEVTSSSDLRAKVVPASADGKSGKIEIKSSSIVDEYSKVIVFVSNGEKVVMKSIGFEQAGITISNGAEQTIGAEGGRVNLNFASNIDWKVAIPAEAQSWVQLAPQRSAMTEYSVALSVAPNTNLGTRSATVQVMTKDGSLAVDYTITQSAFTAVTVTNANGWNAGDALAVFTGNARNQQFKYMGAAGATSGAFEAASVASGSAAAASAHYAVYPYKSNYRLSDGAILMTLPNSQSYVAGGYSSALDVMVGVSNGVADTNIALQPLCAYVCVKLWGSEQTIKSVTLASKGGEALAGNASVTPKYGAAPECVFTTKPSSIISMSCTELTLGGAEASATEFWFVVPPVALASGYSVKVAGFYGGEQTIEFPATTFVSGTIYNIGAEVTVSTNGPGMGVGGWGDGGEHGGSVS